MRPATACYSCRMSRRQCKPSRGNPVALDCVRCQRLGLPCSLQSRTRPHTRTEPQLPLHLESHHGEDNPVSVAYGSRTSSNTRSQDWDVNNLSHEWRNATIKHYFDEVHEAHHALFHRTTFEQQVRNGQLPSTIMFSVLALGSRFSTPPSEANGSPNGVEISLRHSLEEEARKTLDVRDVSIPTIQGCILLGTLGYANGKSEEEAVYLAMAVRLCLILDLPRRQCATELERQINLRIWWTLYMSDVWSSAGLRLPRQLSWASDVELPSDEAQFAALSSRTPLSVGRAAHAGIWGEMARLCRIWSEIQDLNRAAVEERLSPMDLAPQIADLAGRLKGWEAALPDSIKESRENLQQAAVIGHGVSLAALHLGFHYYHQVLLYRYVAESQRTATPAADLYASECVKHARAFCDLLYMCENLPGCKCLYAMVGHMLVITSTVYVHMLLFGSGDDEANHIRARLEHNFEILTELQQHWDTLETSLARLRAFHNACLYSIEQSFSMDRWMLTFILQHGTSIPEKFPGLVEEVPEFASQSQEKYLGYTGDG